MAEVVQGLSRSRAYRGAIGDASRLEDARTFPDERWRERARPSERDVIFVDEQDGVFNAMVSAFLDDDADMVHLVAMWVAPELRGSGVARDLVEQIIEWSRSHGRVRVVLSVEGGNARAARLYEKCGFVEPDTPPPLAYEPRPGTRFYEYTL